MKKIKKSREYLKRAIDKAMHKYKSLNKSTLILKMRIILIHFSVNMINNLKIFRMKVNHSRLPTDHQISFNLLDLRDKKISRMKMIMKKNLRIMKQKYSKIIKRRNKRHSIHKNLVRNRTDKVLENLFKLLITYLYRNLWNRKGSMAMERNY